MHARTSAFLTQLDEAGLRKKVIAPWGDEFSLMWIFWRYREAGIDEFILGYAPGIEELQGDWMVTADQLEAYAGVIEDL